MDNDLKDKERIIGQVDAIMRFEGMSLTGEDKERLRKCYGKSKANYKRIRQNLIKKHTVSDPLNDV